MWLWNKVETLEWWFIPLNDFEGDYDQEKMVIFDIKLMVGFGCDTIPILQVPPQYLIMGKGLTGSLCILVWVPSKQASSGLCRKLPLQQKKWCVMMRNEVNVRPKPCAVPRLTVGLHWEAELTGRGAHTRVCKWKVMVDDPRTVLRWFGVIPTDEIKCCGTSVQPLQSVNLFE